MYTIGFSLAENLGGSDMRRETGDPNETKNKILTNSKITCKAFDWSRNFATAYTGSQYRVLLASRRVIVPICAQRVSAVYLEVCRPEPQDPH